MQNLSHSKNKLRHAYLLTPQFLKRYVAEYEALQAEIKALKAEMNSSKGGPQ